MIYYGVFKPGWSVSQSAKFLFKLRADLVKYTEDTAKIFKLQLLKPTQ